MIQHKFLIFETQERFERLLRSGEINAESIAFIKKPLKIWTHNEYWDCSGSIDQQALEQILNDSDFLKKGDALGKINDQVFLQGDSVTIETSEGIKYVAGEGIEINGTTINIKPATDNTLGGIKLGYPAYGNNRPVQVDGLNRAYVTIPNSGGGTSGSKYYEMLFCTTTDESYPELPTNNDSKGWKTAVDNADGKKIVWMITRLVDGDTVGPWEGPFRISGANGENGVDGDKLEFIYCLSNDGVNKPSLYDINDQNDDYVPIGWTDNPSGINPTNKYEWMSFRTKVHSESDRKGTWTRFADPILWSAWGKQGLDGDGVEYIFYTSNGSYPTINPYDWYGDIGYDTREYIRGYQTNTNLPDQWQDDPYDLNLMPQGSKTWVSIRRQTTGTDGELHWGRYSNPTLWAYYAMDGDAGIGIVADLDNDMMAVSLKANGTNEAFTQTAVAKMYNGVSEISATASILSVKDMLGNNIAYDSFISISGNTITVNIADGAINFSTVGHISVVVRCTSTVNGATVTRDAVLQIIGITFGTGYNYSLKTSCGIIRHAKNGTVSPESIKVWCSKTSGDSPETKWTPSNIAQNSSLEFDNDGRQFKFTYAIDELAAQDLTTDTISTENIADRLVVNLLYKQNGVWILVDSETIYVVADGTDGLTVPAVTYNIQVTKLALQKYPESNTLAGDLKYKIQRVEGAETEYISYLNSHNVTTELICGGFTYRPQYIDNAWQQIIQTPWSDDKCFSQIIVKEGGVIRASLVVPTIMNGKDGADAQAQTLGGKVIRMRVWEENPDPSYSNGELAQNGVFYEDVVAYGNDLYLCIRNNDGVLPTDTTYWQPFQTMSSASFNTMLAESAYIQNLTAKQIVITNDQNVPVAGVINGTYITSSEGLNEQADNGIRIFAGAIPNGGSVADTAFNVDQYGNVKAGFGAIEFSQDGSGQLANGKIRWDSEGNLTVFSLNPLVGGSNFAGENAATNSIMISRMLWDKTSSSGQYDKLYVFGFIVKHGFVLRHFYVGLSVTMPSDNTAYARNFLYEPLRNAYQFQNVFANGDSVAIVPLDPYTKLLVMPRTTTDMYNNEVNVTVYANSTYVYDDTVTWQNVN